MIEDAFLSFRKHQIATGGIEALSKYGQPEETSLCNCAQTAAGPRR
jgi:hypothetical protein